MSTTTQMILFPEFYNEKLKPVNVASVPQRSPFRYPGGKTWFVPAFRQWIKHKYPKPLFLVEPFAGGGIISLTSVFENLVEKAVMVELDEDIASVWESIISGDAEWLATKILNFKITKETVIQEISKPCYTKKEKAFRTILKNRTFHGGILAEGSGLIKFGENGKGIRSRWYPETIAKRILDMKLIIEKIEFRNTDGLIVLEEFSSDPNTVFFIDPPYTAGGKKAGKRLYKNYQIDHEYLFRICTTLKGDFLITYDNSLEVKSMAKSYGFQMRLIPMKNTHHTTMEELVIGKDLSWMDTLPSVRNPEFH